MTFALLGPILISIAYPTEAIYIAIGIFVGRLIFTLSYSYGGPGARLPGALIMDAALFAGFVYLVKSTFRLTE